MDLASFKLDIDELITDFSNSNSKTLTDMKTVWLSRKFSFIYEARPTTNVSFFMQSLFSHSITHMLSPDSLSKRLAGLYCLYCLYETQPFKPHFKIYLSLGDLKKLKTLVVEAKQANITIVPALVKKMIDKHMFLFGFVDTNDRAVIERVNEITKTQNARVKVAYEKLLANTPIDRFLHMDLGKELDLELVKKLSKDYEAAKRLAVNEGGKVVDVGNIKHIIENKTSAAVERVEKVVGEWNSQKELFNQQTRVNNIASAEENQVVCYQSDEGERCLSEEEDKEEEEEEEEEEDEFTRELRSLLE